jgi:hypothetical protein
MWRTAKWDSTGYCSSTVDFLQPPPATVHPPSTSSCLHRLLFIHRVLFIQPPLANLQPALHGVLFIQPPPAPFQPALHTGSYSTSPPQGPVQPALHGVPPPATVHPPPPPRSGSCSSSGNCLYYHGVLFIQPPSGTVHPTLTGDCSSRGSFDRLQLASVAKKSLGFSQQPRDRSGFSNVASAIARV